MPTSSRTSLPKSLFAAANPVLVIARNTALQKIMQRIVSMAGYNAVIVSAGLTGLEVLRTRAFSAVVLDLEHPVAQQRDLCARIIALMSGLPVMVLSASPNAADRTLFLELGTDDYVALPFSPSALATRLAKLMRPAWGTPKKDLALRHSVGPSVLTATFLIASTGQQPTQGRHFMAVNEGGGPPLGVQVEDLVSNSHG